MSDGCLACREVSGDVELPGGLVWADELAIAFHVMPTDENPRPYLGHCMVVTVRHVDHLGDLTEAEVASVAQASRAVARGLRGEGAERVYVAVIGPGDEHFHQHLFPRYRGVPPGTPWMSVDELPDAPHGDADQIAALVERLRARL